MEKEERRSGETIRDIVRESCRIKEDFFDCCSNDLIILAKIIASTFLRGGKLMLCGNGGSAADAQHLAAEFVNRLDIERRPLPAILLSTDASILTCIGNDYSFNDIFSKQIKALGYKNDILLCISTSGNSQNVINAAETAKDMGIYIVSLTGGNGGKLKQVSDICLIVPSENTARIQESHIVAGHILCKLVDNILFNN